MSGFYGRPYKIVMLDNQTKESRLCPVFEGAVWEDHTAYWWGEGNMGCDCNRAGVFSGGKPLAHSPHGHDYNACGHERYTIEAVVFDEGTEKANWVRPEDLGLDGADGLISELRAALRIAAQALQQLSVPTSWCGTIMTEVEKNETLRGMFEELKRGNVPPAVKVPPAIKELD